MIGAGEQISSSVPPDENNRGTVNGSGVVLTDREVAAYQAGYLQGLDRGRQLAEDEIATLQRTAAEVVHGMAKLGDWPEQVQRAKDAREAERQRFRDAHARGRRGVA